MSSTAARSVIGRKEHACDLCGTTIPKGDHHWTWTWFSDDGACRLHVHELCHRAAPSFGLYDGEEWTTEYPLWEYLRELGPADHGDLLQRHPGEVGAWLVSLLET